MQLFRVIALVEGVTTIALFLIAMPLKYWAGNPALVPPVGMAHGVAWLAYVLGMVLCLPGYRLSALQTARVFVFALFPFGTFLNEPMLKRKQEQRAQARRGVLRA